MQQECGEDQVCANEETITSGRSHLQLSRTADVQKKGCDCSAELEAAIAADQAKHKASLGQSKACSQGDNASGAGCAFDAGVVPTWCDSPSSTEPCDHQLDVCNGKDTGCREIGIGDGDCDVDMDCYGAHTKCGQNNCGHFRSMATAQLMSADWDEDDDCCYTTEKREPESLPCMPFCLDTGCPCLVPWSERCDITSCSGCVQCGGAGGMLDEANWHPDRHPHMIECTGGQYSCASQSKAQDMCRVSGGYTLCDVSEMKTDMVGTNWARMCRYMWTASSEHEGYMIGSGTDGCGRVDVLESTNRTWAGRQMFNAACCPIPSSKPSSKEESESSPITMR